MLRIKVWCLGLKGEGDAKSLKIFFATRNRDKLKEVQAILSSYGISVEWLETGKLEVQTDSLRKIARVGVLSLSRKGWSPVLVEDTGLFIEALKGFPGPYSSYVYRTIGNKGVLRLMEGVQNRKAVFRCVVAYRSRGGKPLTFQGEAWGTIAYEERGVHWGFDPIFEHGEAGGLTYAEMGSAKKNTLSHRRKALDKFADWYLMGGGLKQGLNMNPAR